MSAPCMNCKDRGQIVLNGKSYNCHTLCPKYRAFREKLKELKEEESKEKYAAEYFISHKHS